MTTHELPSDMKTGAMHDAALLVKARGVTKRFGGLLAVNNVDFDIPRGSIVSRSSRSIDGVRTTESHQ